MAIKKIKELMKKNGVSGYWLEKNAGLTKNTVHYWFKRNATPTLSSLEKVAKVFGVKLTDLLEDESDD